MTEKHRPDSERGGRPWEHPYRERVPWTVEKYQRDVWTLEPKLKAMVPDKIGTLTPYRSVQQINYPVLVTPKVRGVHCLTLGDGRVVDSNLNDILNFSIRMELSNYGIGGLDGVITIAGELDKSAIVNEVAYGNSMAEFEYHVFDLWAMTLEEYSYRVANLELLLPKPRPPMIRILNPVMVYDTNGLIRFWNKCVDDGHDGVMIRRIHGKYTRQGVQTPRGTLDELSIQDEGTGTILIAKCTNNRLDAFIISDRLGNKLDVAHGYTEKQREFFWKTRKQHIGYDLTYKYNPGGDGPRNLVFVKTTPR